MKRVLILPLVLVLALLIAVPVSAGPPVIETGEFDIDFVPFDPSPCPGIEIHDPEVATYRMTSFFDNQGNLVRVRTHYIGVDHLYNPLNPDVVLTGSFSGSQEFDLRTGEESVSGLPFHITVPGYGTVLVRAGRWSVYPSGHLAGKDSLFDPEDMEQLCSLLAGD